MKAKVRFIFTSVNFTGCSAVGLDAVDAEACSCERACAGDRRRGRTTFGTSAPKVVAEDLREIADVEFWRPNPLKADGVSMATPAPAPTASPHRKGGLPAGTATTGTRLVALNPGLALRA